LKKENGLAIPNFDKRLLQRRDSSTDIPKIKLVASVSDNPNERIEPSVDQDIALK
jgi:hypothetical protein